MNYREEKNIGEYFYGFEVRGSGRSFFKYNIKFKSYKGKVWKVLFFKK